MSNIYDRENPRYAETIKSQVLSRYSLINQAMQTADYVLETLMSMPRVMDFSAVVMAHSALVESKTRMNRLIADYLEPIDAAKVMRFEVCFAKAEAEIGKADVPNEMDSKPRGYILAKHGLRVLHTALGMRMDSLRDVLRAKNWLSEDFHYVEHVGEEKMAAQSHDWAQERAAELKRSLGA